MNPPIIRKALDFVIHAHEGQLRKGTGYPYVIHPICVFSIVKKYKESKNSELILCGSLLHDVLEDTQYTYDFLVKEFSKEIADLVLELTNNKDEIIRIGKLEYTKQKLLNMSSYALVIKLADILDNMTDSPLEKSVNRYIEVVNYVTENRVLTTSQIAIAAEIKRSYLWRTIQ